MLICFPHGWLKSRGRAGGGQTALEYALVLGAVGLSAFAAMRLLGSGILRSPGLHASAAGPRSCSISGPASSESEARASGKTHTIILDEKK